MVKLDGTEYADIVVGIRRTFQVLDTANTGRLSNGDMFRELVGTFYNYTLTIDGDFEISEYDDFYEKISAPDESHTLEVPYGTGSLTFDAYVTSGSDNYVINGNYYNGLSVNFIAMQPQRRA